MQDFNFPQPIQRRSPRYLKPVAAVVLSLTTIAFAENAATGRQQATHQESQWIRPQSTKDPLVWGRRDGIVFGLPMASASDIHGELLRASPRGLIRVGLFSPDSKTPNQNTPKLLNFIAVEPVITGVGARFDRLAFSELEMSTLDPGKRGKRMWIHPGPGQEDGDTGGTLETLHSGKATVERLSVRIDIERFTANGAHVYVIASIDSDHPQELRLSTFAEPDSPPIEELSLTATMGNYERLRQLWLKDRVETSLNLFGDYTGNAFVEKESYPLGEILRTGEGDAIVFCTSNEASPAHSPGNDTAHWPYLLPKITQYWRVPGRDVQPDLRVRVNSRFNYYGSTSPVLGGIAFENFEVRERYTPGQSFIFGITPQDPWEFYRGTSPLTRPTESHNTASADGSSAKPSHKLSKNSGVPQP